MLKWGVPARPKIYNLFAACLPQPDRRRFGAQPLRKRQNLIPVMLLTLQWDNTGPDKRYLLEVNTLHLGASTYPGFGRGAVPGGLTPRGKPAHRICR